MGLVSIACGGGSWQRAAVPTSLAWRRANSLELRQGRFGLAIRKKLFTERLVGRWPWWSHHPWRGLKGLWSWCLGTGLGGGVGSVGRTVGLDDLKGLFQRKWGFRDSTSGGSPARGEPHSTRWQQPPLCGEGAGGEMRRG